MESSDRKIRVVVADDSRTALRAVCSFLEFEGQFEIVATAGDGLGVLRQAERFHPDLVLTDLSMPQMSGLEAAMQLRRSFPELRILIFTELNGFFPFGPCACKVSPTVSWKKAKCRKALWRKFAEFFPKIRKPVERTRNQFGDAKGRECDVDQKNSACG